MKKGYSTSNYKAQLQIRDIRLSDLGFASYSAYLRSDLWKDAKARLSRSGRRRACYVCAHRGRLEVHHRSYRRIGRERAADLIYLCAGCHKKVHRGIERGELGGTLWSAAKRLKTGKPYRMPGKSDAERRRDAVIENLKSAPRFDWLADCISDEEATLTYGPKQRSLTVTDLASQETSRPRNVLWDALVAAFGYSPQLRGEQKLWGRVCVELGEAGATPVQVAAAARAYLERYPGVAFTPTALVKHWSQLLAPDARSQQPSQAGRLLRIADDLEAAG